MGRDELIERILDVTERDSVIEGLPPFSAEFKQEMREDLLCLWDEENPAK